MLLIDGAEDIEIKIIYNNIENKKYYNYNCLWKMKL